jgi:Zn-dependent protease
MHKAGWVLIVLCMLLGVCIQGGWLGVVLGLAIVASLLMHEVGHMAAAILNGVKVHEFGLKVAGAYTRREVASRRGNEVFISAAGPLMNLCLIGPLLLVPQIGNQLALCNVMLCVVNLLPIPASDGLHILKLMRQPKAVVFSAVRRPGSSMAVR